MKFKAWMVLRLMRSPRHWLSVTTILGLVGIMIGVGSLVVAMAVVSGYETTLKNSVIDIFGDMMVVRRAATDPSVPNTIDPLLPELEGLKAWTPFVYVEAIIAHKGKVGGVVLEGIDAASVSQVLKIKEKVIAGEFAFTAREGMDGVLIGKGIAKKFGLKVGDQLKVVTPVAADSTGRGFKPRLAKFWVNGIIDLGRYDYDLRYILSDVKVAQNFAQIGDRFSGFRLKFKSPEMAQANNVKISNKFGNNYWSRDWFEVNRNLFEAIKLEKAVIFFVLLIIVIAAAFNIASNMFLNVMRRFHEISILKTMGADRKFLIRLFTGQALLISLVGATLGILLGLAACGGFLWAQTHLDIWPEEIYKLTRISVELRALDLLAIMVISIVICLIAVQIPVRRGADLHPVEGLRYE